MKASELRNKSDKELVKDLADQQAKLSAAAIEYRTKEVKNVKQIATIKKDIARILTIQTEQEKSNE
ncbi:50S ribosomal protein L29 [Candidatus Saccharibacteria bacterium]|nr:50S ribosomal protein L29 [Candidatus Saccharibacteria bacterium]